MDLDHIGILVPDLGVARSLLERCGFLLTEPELLMSGRGTGARWSGGVNTVAMFEDGYVEIQELQDPTLGHPLADRAAGFGVQVLALGTRDADAEWTRLARAGEIIPEPAEWTRRVEWGRRSMPARFRFFPLPSALVSTSAYTVVIQHLTPEEVRPPGITVQPNGVVALSSVVEVTADPEAATVAYAELLGAEARSTRDGFLVQMERGDIELVDPVACERRYGYRPPAPGEIVALRITARDPGRVAEAFRRAGFAVAPDSGSFRVSARRALGIDLHLEAAA